MNLNLATYSQSKKTSILFFVGAFLFTFIFYFAGHGAMLMDDALWAIFEIKKQGFQGYLNSYGTTAFYFGHYLFIILLQGLFGLKSLGWFVTFCLLHALNATLLFNFLAKLFRVFFYIEHPFKIALIGSIFFLISCYHSENIIWGATSHYALSLLIFLKIANDLLLYIEQGKITRSIYFNILLFSFSLITLEISFLFPILYVTLFACLYFSGNKCLTWKQFILSFVSPLVLMIAIYIFFYFIKTGNFLPPDRSGSQSVGLTHQITTFFQSLTKAITFVNFSDYKTREWFYYFCTKIIYILPLSISFLVLITYRLNKKNKRYAVLFIFFVLGFLIFSLPFVRLAFIFLPRIETDRYLYFPSVFLLPMIVFLLFQFKWWLRNSLLFIYTLLFIMFGWKNVVARSMSAKLNTKFIRTFPDNNLGQIYLLNIPSSCADAYMYRAKHRLNIALDIERNITLDSNINQVAWYNSQTDKDSFEVKKMNDSCFHVQLKTNGSWWMHEHIGASNFENNAYKFELDPWGGYTISFKTKPSKSDKVLLFNSHHFIKVN